jgi:RES domain-containing protein
MMNIYRIVKQSYAVLDGIGGIYASGRWHRKGTRVVYASGSISLAAWEKFIHVSSLENLPDDLQVMKIEVPDSILVSEIDTEQLDSTWADFPYCEMTQEIGSRFLQDPEQLILKVPSAVIKSESNYLINPTCDLINKLQYSLHPFAFDGRIGII